MPKTPDFTAYAHPVLAVACPKCGSRPGIGCNIERESWSSDYHLERKNFAGEVFVQQHGQDAEISRVEGIWIIGPVAYLDGNAGYSGPVH